MPRVDIQLQSIRQSRLLATVYEKARCVAYMHMLYI